MENPAISHNQNIVNNALLHPLAPHKHSRIKPLIAMHKLGKCHCRTFAVTKSNQIDSAFLRLPPGGDMKPEPTGTGETKRVREFIL